MKPDLADLLGDDGPAGGPGDKPGIGEALGETPDGDGDSGTDVTAEAKHETGAKLLAAFESKDPTAMFDAVADVIALAGD